MEEATKLRCRNDRYEMAAWKIKGTRDAEGALDGRGFYMYVACELGDHYLAPGAVSQIQPYVWPDSRSAWAAVERWNQEHQP